MESQYKEHRVDDWQLGEDDLDDPTPWKSTLIKPLKDVEVETEPMQKEDMPIWDAYDNDDDDDDEDSQEEEPQHAKGSSKVGDDSCDNKVIDQLYETHNEKLTGKNFGYDGEKICNTAKKCNSGLNCGCQLYNNTTQRRKNQTSIKHFR